MAKKSEPLPIGYILVKKQYYHIRAKASQFSDSLGYAKAGEKLPYLGNEDHGWLKVRIGEKIGWLYRQAGELVLAELNKLHIKPGKWHVRTAPGSQYDDMGIVTGDDELIDQGETRKGYRLVIFKNQNGWILTRAIDVPKE